MSEKNTAPYPIILSHGIARPDILVFSLLRKLGLTRHPFFYDRFHYFRLIATHLRNNGFEVYHTSVSFAEDLETRAKDLTKEVQRIIKESKKERFHVIGHSMGGLDARKMIVDEGMEPHVVTLTTIGTPHLGTSFADWGLANGGNGLIKLLQKLIELDGFADLSTDACIRFGKRIQNAEAKNSVFYQTYSSWQENDLILLPFQFSGNIILEYEGKNDGLVPVSSQKWTGTLNASDGTKKRIEQHEFPMRADHFNQIGWWHVNMLHGSRWWSRIFHRRNIYEQSIQNVYLQIAKGLRDKNLNSEL
ncbi:MAG: lipase family alpha/beta hydrolase [Calditrichia bacterium]